MATSLFSSVPATEAREGEVGHKTVAVTRDPLGIRLTRGAYAADSYLQRLLDHLVLAL